ncbi:MAG: hypothetical protein HOH81_10255, partial [Flavobacteriaceae bacterium]|nr:hypothetical protein [Flavobacteriaceae bacterium]
MAEKFRGKYRIPSNRYKNWDYRNNGYYFITICTQNREHFFGKIVDDQMVLNELGEIVHTQWYASEKIRQNIFLDEFVIMPNHIHGIGNAFYGSLSFENGVPSSNNFDGYRMIRLREAPKHIDIHFVENNEDPTGLGEP